MADKKSKKTFLVIALATVLCIFAAAVTYGYWSVSGTTINFLTMASYKNQIEEEYEIPHHVNPSEVVTKIVNVSNTGTVDTIIRVLVTKAFGVRGADGSFTEDNSLDPKMIKIDFNNRYWMKGEDGYYYYKGILKAGETTKEPLFSSYQLSTDAGNEYKGKDAQIIVMMESVQAEGDAVSVWGITYSDIGITRPPAKPSKDTSVTYLGKEKGFDITTKKTDLFASFKNLLPGCARTQRIYVNNNSADNVEIFLRAESISQVRMSAEEKELVEQLLNKEAIIEITDGKKCIYKGPVAGNLSGVKSTMRDNISLGVFPGGSTRELTVTLSLSPQMDNRYLNLTGKVKWVFTAVGEEDAAVYSATVPQTGDGTRIGMWIALFITSGIFLAGAAWIEKKSRRTDKKK